MKVLKTIMIIFILSTYGASGQTGSIMVKRPGSSHISLSLAKVTTGELKLDSLLKDPNIRIENSDKDSIVLRKCLLVFNINGISTDFTMFNPTTLTAEQILKLKTAKNEYKNKILIEEIFAVNKRGEKVFLEPLVLTLRP